MKKPWLVLALIGTLAACDKGHEEAAKAPVDEVLFEHGATVFTRNCSTCHDISGGSNRAGPMLGGVAGRKAGTVQGFTYSYALKESGVTWNAETLDHWLAGPSDFIPGTVMQISPITDPAERRALIEYLMNQ
jgi:cytochrome c